MPRLVPAGHDLDYPEVPLPGPALLAGAGAEGLRKLVFRHHERLRAHPEIAHLFASDDARFVEAVGYIADFVIEMSGGPRNFTAARGNECLRTRHFPFTIDERGREIWLENLYRAMAETVFPEALRPVYWAWMEPLSIRMVNRRTTKAQPLRVSWQEAAARYTAA
jgi:hemoglobin